MIFFLLLLKVNYLFNFIDFRSRNVTPFLQRVYINNKKQLSKKWLKEYSKELKTLLKSINKRTVDSSIIDILKNNSLFSTCKILDAIHLATAFEYKLNLSNNFYLCSFDKKMKTAAKKLKMKSLPE